MLREIGAAKQDSSGSRKQWFSDPAMDLFVWREPSGDIRKFQLACKGGIDAEGEGPEQALTWSASGGFTRNLVDDGEQEPARYKASPILVPAGRFPVDDLIEMFVDRARDIEPFVRGFVFARLHDLQAG